MASMHKGKALVAIRIAGLPEGAHTFDFTCRARDFRGNGLSETIFTGDIAVKVSVKKKRSGGDGAYLYNRKSRLHLRHLPRASFKRAAGRVPDRVWLWRNGRENRREGNGLPTDRPEQAGDRSYRRCARNPAAFGSHENHLFEQPGLQALPSGVRKPGEEQAAGNGRIVEKLA